MKYLPLIFIFLAGCVYDHDLQAHLEAEQDFARHQYHVEQSTMLEAYDPEYVSDCYYYEELICEFE